MAKNITPRMQGWFNIQKSFSVVDHIEGITEKKI